MASRIIIRRKNYVGRALAFPFILLIMFIQWALYDVLVPAWNLTHDGD